MQGQENKIVLGPVLLIVKRQLWKILQVRDVAILVVSLFVLEDFEKRYETPIKLQVVVST